MPINFPATFIKVAKIISKVNNSKSTAIAFKSLYQTIIAIQSKLSKSLEYKLKEIELNIAQIQYDFKGDSKEKNDRLKEKLKEYQDAKIKYVNDNFNNLIKNIEETKDHVIKDEEKKKINEFINKTLKQVGLEEYFSYDDMQKKSLEAPSIYDDIEIEEPKYKNPIIINLENTRFKIVKEIISENQIKEQEILAQKNDDEEKKSLLRKAYDSLKEVESSIFEKEYKASRLFDKKDDKGFYIIPKEFAPYGWAFLGADLTKIEDYKSQDKNKSLIKENKNKTLTEENNFDPEIIKQPKWYNKLWNKLPNLEEKNKSTFLFTFFLIFTALTLVNLTFGALLMGSLPIFIGIIIGEVLLVSDFLLPKIINANNYVVQQKELAELDNAKILGERLLEELTTNLNNPEAKKLLNELNSTEEKVIIFNKNNLEEITDPSKDKKEDIIEVRNFTKFKNDTQKRKKDLLSRNKVELGIKTTLNIGIIMFLAFIIALDIVALVSSGIGFFVMLSLIVDITFALLTIGSIALDVYSIPRNEKLASKMIINDINQYDKELNKKIKHANVTGVQFKEIEATPSKTNVDYAPLNKPKLGQGMIH